MTSLVVLVLLLAFVLSAFPLQALLGIDPYATDLLSRFDPPSADHWLGTDEAGRDELLRLMVGGQISLLVGAARDGDRWRVRTADRHSCRDTSVGGSMLCLMRFTDGMIALPLLPLLIVLGALDLTKLGFTAEFAHSGAAGFWRIVVIISLVDWTATARIARASTLSLKQRDLFAPRARVGRDRVTSWLTHILPNIATPLIVAITLTVGRVILLESVLSFLGFGVVPPTPSWGNMLNNAQELVTQAPALAIYPGLLIFVTVIAVNFLGDGLQHAFDPRSER